MQINQIKRKYLVVGIILLFVGTYIIPAIAYGIEKPLLPTSRGNILYVGGSGPGNYTRIKDAINNASDGDTIFVYDDSSPYLENLTITKTINLIGEGKETTIIDGDGYHYTIVLNAEHVTIENFSIIHGAYSISMLNYGNCIISNNILIRAIFMDGESGNNVFTRNIINDNLQIWSNDNLFSLNQMNYYNGDVLGCMRIYGNKNIIERNTISGNKTGFTGLSIQEGDNNIISGNTISSFTSYGIDISSSKGNVISNNTIRDNKIGLRLEEGYMTQIFQNNFINNSHNAFFYLFSFANHWDNNYWDRPRIEPYMIIGRLFLLIIPWVNFDWRPAQEPFDIDG
jgi:parallel beta-helix repeat protein